MEIKAVILPNELGFEEGFILYGEPALKMVRQGLAKLIEEKRDTRSQKKTEKR